MESDGPSLAPPPVLAPEPRPLPDAPTEPSWRREPRPPLRKRLLAPLAALLALLAKFKAVIFLLPKLKLLITLGSSLVSIAAYSIFFGWLFALGFVVLLFVHEMGHVIALRREGIKASAPMFIPFLGAVISARSLGDDALAEARVGLAGPILGSAGAGVALIVAEATGSPFWRALAYIGFFLNLFNLLPVVPLDGGRAMAAMAPWMWFGGFAGLVAIAIFFHNALIWIIVLFGALETRRRWRARRAGGPEQEAYYRVAPRYRLAVAAVYLGLIGLLALGLHATFVPRAL